MKLDSIFYNLNDILKLTDISSNPNEMKLSFELGDNISENTRLDNRLNVECFANVSIPIYHKEIPNILGINNISVHLVRQFSGNLKLNEKEIYAFLKNDIEKRYYILLSDAESETIVPNFVLTQNLKTVVDHHLSEESSINFYNQATDLVDKFQSNERKIIKTILERKFNK